MKGDRAAVSEGLAWASEHGRRFATLYVSSPILTRILRLPEGVECNAVFAAPHVDAVGFRLHSPLFELSPPGVRLPEVEVEMHSCPTCRGPVFENIVLSTNPLAARVVDWQAR